MQANRKHLGLQEHSGCPSLCPGKHVSRGNTGIASLHTWAQAHNLCVWGCTYTLPPLHIFLSDIFFITFQMLSRKSTIPSPCPAPLPTHSHFLALAFPCTGAYKVCKTKGSLFRLGHLLLHMQLEIRVLGVQVRSYFYSTYRVADPFSSLGAFSSSSTRGPVYHPIDAYEHPLLYMLGTGIASQEIAISGSCQLNLAGIQLQDS